MENEVVKRGRKSPNQKAFDKIDTIEPGSFMIFPKEEWLLKTLPGAHIIRRHLNREFKVETLKSGKGWKITAYVN